MDTATTPPPPPPQPPAPPARTSPPSWWRRPLADVVDLTVLGVLATTAGFAVAFAYAAPSDDPWAGLAAALLGLAAAGLVAVVGWVALLVAVGTGRSTPGERVTGSAPTRRVLAAAGRHLAIVVAGWSALGAVASLPEPPPAGIAGGAVGAGVAAAALVLAYGRGSVATRLGIVAGAVVVGGAVAGGVPDRGPYPWELRETAVAALVADLEATPGAERACHLVGTGGVPQASHATSDCYDPDRVWSVQRPPALVTEHLAAVVRIAVGGDGVVTVDRRFDALAVTVDDDVVVLVSGLDGDCAASRVVLDRYDVRPDVGQQASCV